MKYKKEIILVLCGIVMSLSVDIASMVLTDKVFFETKQVREFEKMLKDKSVPLPDSSHPKVTINMPGLKWTWYSYAFYIVLPSLFWFSFGRVVLTAKAKGKWLICFLPAVITAAGFLDIFVPLYLALYYLGARSTEK